MAPDPEDQHFNGPRVLSSVGAEEEHRKDTEKSSFKPQWVWTNVILFVILHYLGFWSIWLLLSGQVKWQTIVLTFMVGVVSVESIMIGCHRFYSHKAFKGTVLFKIMVITFTCLAGQNSVYTWVRDHRLHHKYSETDADPHNAKRGFWFSHMTWLMQRKHPEVRSKGKNVNMSDLEADPLVMWQHKYFFPLWLTIGVVIPTALPIFMFNESLKAAFLIAFWGRYMITLHGTWTVNSFAHLYGNKPYTRDIGPVESNFVAFITSGEGWHNYHHTFPWDYRAGEFGKKWNVTSKIVDFFAYLGIVYDLKYATMDMVHHRVLKRGDGSHPIAAHGTLLDDKTTFNDVDDDLFGEKVATAISHARCSVSS